MGRHLFRRPDRALAGAAPARAGAGRSGASRSSASRTAVTDLQVKSITSKSTSLSPTRGNYVRDLKESFQVFETASRRRDRLLRSSTPIERAERPPSPKQPVEPGDPDQRAPFDGLCHGPDQATIPRNTNLVRRAAQSSSRKPAQAI
jgi:hypothetical protein